LHEVNSAAFLAPLSIYSEYNDRIGPKPYLHTLDKLTAIDIDWEEDFIVAEQLLLHGVVSI
jgi:CMP-N-acetylneuraminic acid synthetase